MGLNILAMKHEKVKLIACGRYHTILATGKLFECINLNFEKKIRFKNKK